VFTARYGLSPYITQIRLVFITEVESVYCAVRTEYITQIRLVFIAEVESVYCAVRTESLYNTDTSRLYNRGGECLQRGTD
jgi:hypothetical protein